MRHTIFAAALLVGCTTTPVAQVDADAQESAVSPACGADCPVIFHEVTSWGRQVFRSRLHPDGSYLAERLDFNSGAVTETVRRQVGVEGYQAAYVALRPLEAAKDRSVYCSNAPTDGPSGVYTWDEENRFSIYYGCYGVDPSLSHLQRAEEQYEAIVAPAEG